MNSEVRNVIIIGGGIAAHTAALYTARASLKPLVLAGIKADQLSLTSTVENFPGFIDGILGPKLVEDARKQAEKFGAEYLSATAESFQVGDGIFTVVADGTPHQGRTVIICTGASARWLGAKGEEQYIGKGVSTCATCDAAFYRDKTVLVIGGGDTAMEEALTLYKFAKKITIVHRRDEFRASDIMQKRVLELTDKIDVIWSHEIAEVLGDGTHVTGARLRNVTTSEETNSTCDGIFLAIGHDANTKIFEGKVTLDDHKYIITDKRSRTNIDGVYAAGDVADPVFRQAITSAGTGCQAAIEAERYIENLKVIGKY